MQRIPDQPTLRMPETPQLSGLACCHQSDPLDISPSSQKQAHRLTTIEQTAQDTEELGKAVPKSIDSLDNVRSYLKSFT